MTVTLCRSAPTGIRTPVLTLKGSRPGPLDDGGGMLEAGGILSSHLIMVKRLLLPDACSAFCVALTRCPGYGGWFVFFGALIKQRQHIDLFAVEKDAGAFHFKIGDQDGGQRGIKERHKVAGLIRD